LVIDTLHAELVQSDGSAFLMMRGEIDMASAPVFGEAMARTMALGMPVVLDFAEVTFMDSSGLNVLIRAETTSKRPLSMCVRHPCEQVSRLLTMTGLERLIDAGSAPQPVDDVSEQGVISDNGPNQ
jgi:anti-sigma B factor antagonist